MLSLILDIFPSHYRSRTVDQMEVYPEFVGPLLRYCSEMQISDFQNLEVFLHKVRPTKSKCD